MSSACTLVKVAVLEWTELLWAVTLRAGVEGWNCIDYVQIKRVYYIPPAPA